MLGIPFTDKPEGPISAAVIAAGVGAFASGLLTTLARESVKDWLQWSDDVGPLSGKTILAVIVWLVSGWCCTSRFGANRMRAAAPRPSP